MAGPGEAKYYVKIEVSKYSIGYFVPKVITKEGPLKQVTGCHSRANASSLVRRSTDGSTGRIANAKLCKNRTLGLSVWYGLVRAGPYTRRIGTTNAKFCKKRTLAKIVRETN